MLDGVIESLMRTALALAHDPTSWLCATLVAYAFGMWLYRKSGYSPFLTPLVTAIVLLVAVLLIGVAARLVRKIFHFAGFGFVDVLLGIVVAAAKYLLLLSLAFAAFEKININYSLLSKEKIEASKGYEPVRNLSRQILPFVDWLGDEVEKLHKE